MWFKNLKIYRLAPGTDLTVSGLNASLGTCEFRPCGSQESQSSGWVPPDHADGWLVYQQAGQMLITLRTEKRLLPAAVVNVETRKRAQQIEEQQGYRPGRKQTKDIKEQVTLDLLPKAFVTQTDTHAWIDAANGWFVVDAASAAKADEVLGLLAKCLNPLPVMPLHVNTSPAGAMTTWLLCDEPPAGFAIDQDIELQATTQSRATVRWLRQSVDPKEAEGHIQAGKQCTRLALTWNDRMSFVLTENLDIKRVEPLDILQEHHDGQAANEAERFDADFALMTGELSLMLEDLIDALGGIRSDAHPIGD